MYLKNCWYVAAWNHEVDDGPLGRVILDEPVVLYRADDGSPVALEDRCVHRRAPLSHGSIEARGLRCGYHGLLFDQTGACVEVPGQTRMPPDASVKSYPVVERWRWVWIWMGEAERADPALIPDYHWNDDPAWISLGDRFYVKGNYRLIVDNLLDLSHVQFVHASTLATAAVVDYPAEVTRDGQHIRIDRWIMDGPAPPMFEKAGGITGGVDRWQLISWTPPTHVVIDVGCARSGTGAREGNRADGIEMYSNHTITPETATTSHYFWHHARNFRLDDSKTTEYLAGAATAAFSEDVVIIEAQQESMESAPKGRPRIDINADSGVLQAARILDCLIDTERT